MILLPPVQTGLWLGVQQALAGLGGRRRPGPVAATVGGVLVAGAVGFGVDSLRRFLVRGTSWHPWDPEKATELVTDGPNAVSRNPMYAAMALGLVGTGLASGRPWTAVAALGLVATVTPQIRREEAALDAVFGDVWRTYAARVPRWVGWPRG